MPLACGLIVFPLWMFQPLWLDGPLSLVDKDYVSYSGGDPIRTSLSI
jgi:hypothetical protein